MYEADNRQEDLGTNKIQEHSNLIQWDEIMSLTKC